MVVLPLLRLRFQEKGTGNLGERENSEREPEEGK